MPQNKTAAETSLERTTATEDDWWEMVDPAVAEDPVDDGKDPVGSMQNMQNPELMLSFMISACSDPEGAQQADANLFQILSRCQGDNLEESGGLLQSVDSLDKFLDIYEKLSMNFRLLGAVEIRNPAEYT